MSYIIEIARLKLKIYKINFVDSISIQLRPLVTLIPYILFSQYFIKHHQNLTSEFIVISFLLMLFVGNIVIMASLAVYDDITHKRSLYYYFSDISLYQVILGNLLAWVIVSLIGTIAAFVTLSLFHDFQWNTEHIYFVIGLIIFEIIISINAGSMIAYFVLKFNNIRIVFYVFSILLFLSGYLYPIRIFPSPLKEIASLNPLFYPLDLMRHYLLWTPAFIDVHLEWVIIVVAAILSTWGTCYFLGKRKYKHVLVSKGHK